MAPGTSKRLSKRRSSSSSDRYSMAQTGLLALLPKRTARRDEVGNAADERVEAEEERHIEGTVAEDEKVNSAISGTHLQHQAAVMDTQQQQPPVSPSALQPILASHRLPASESKQDHLVRRQFAETLRRVVTGASGADTAASFLSLLISEADKRQQQQQQQHDQQQGRGEAPETEEASPLAVLDRCSVLLSRTAEAQNCLRQLYNRAAADCTVLSPSAPGLQLETERIVWLQFRHVLQANATVSLGVRDFVDSVRSGECVLFPRDTAEDTIVESLFPDYKYLIVCKGAESTARALPELFEVRSKTSERINHFHKTAGSEDCKVVEVEGPKTEVRKELHDLEARKLHIVTKDLIDELYEFYRQEMLTGVRATTGAAHVPCDD